MKNLLILDYASLGLYPHTAELIQHYKDNNWSIAIVSNQADCDFTNPTTGKPFKSNDEAVDELRQSMKILGIDRALFCPDLKSWGMYQVKENDLYYRSLGCDECSCFIGFLLPDPGMLLWLKSSANYDYIIFVSDYPEFSQSAQYCEIDFISAKSFFSAAGLAVEENQ